MPDPDVQGFRQYEGHLRHIRRHLKHRISATRGADPLSNAEPTRVEIDRRVSSILETAAAAEAGDRTTKTIPDLTESPRSTTATDAHG